MSHWRAIGASVAGHWHAMHFLGCQDAFATHVKDGIAIACVADGAGSCRYPGMAARATVKWLKEYLAEAFEGKTCPPEEWDGLARQAFYHNRLKLRQMAAEMEVEEEDLWATALVAVAGDGFLYTANIGDGRLAFLDHNGWQAGILPHRGSSKVFTVFVTSIPPRGI